MTSKRVVVWMYFHDHICLILVPGLPVTGHTNCNSSNKHLFWFNEWSLHKFAKYGELTTLKCRYVIQDIPAFMLTQDNQSNNIEQCLHSWIIKPLCSVQLEKKLNLKTSLSLFGQVSRYPLHFIKLIQTFCEVSRFQVMFVLYLVGDSESQHPMA